MRRPPDRRLPPTRRVKRREDYLRIQSVGKKVRTRHFLLSIAPHVSKSADSRIGITITKKVHKSAVRRNYVKRRVREVFRYYRHKLLDSFDIVAIALTGSTELSYEEIRKELLYGFRKSDLFKRGPQRKSKTKRDS